MSILAVGSIALDSVKTPFGEVKDVLGGSATYFSISASNFNDVSLIGVIGNDFPEEYLNLLKEKKVNLDGLQIKNGETFKWSGYYEGNLNEAHTLETHLNLFGDFDPKLPESYRDLGYVFLGNLDPVLQLQVVNQIKKPKIVICDTMNFWIESKYNELLETLKKVDILLINETEAKMLVKCDNLIKCSKKILELGPKFVVIKKGEHGSILTSKDDIFISPAYPCEEVIDPTGAGDTFGGGFLGYLSKYKELNFQVLKEAVIFGTCAASFNIENFSVKRLKEIDLKDIENRVNDFKKIISI